MNMQNEKRTMRYGREIFGLYLAFCVFILLLPASAQDVISGQQAYSLRECIDLGLRKSHLIHAAWQETGISHGRLAEANTAYLPSLSAGMSYTHLSPTDPSEVIINLPAPIGQQTLELSPGINDSYALNLTLKQPVFMGFRIVNNSRKAFHLFNASGEQYKSTRLKLVTDIKKSYWNLMLAEETVKMSAESLQVVKAYLADIKNLFQQGVTTNNEVLKAETEWARAQLTQTNTAQALNLACAQLAYLMGLDVMTPIRITGAPYRPLPSVPDPEYPVELGQYIETAIHHRTELKSISMQIKAADIDIKQALAAWYPAVYLAGNCALAQPNQRIFPLKEQFDFTWDIGVMAGFDMGSWFSIQAKTDQAKARAAQLQELAAQLQNSIALEVMQGYYARNKASEQCQVAGFMLKQAEENQKDIREKFKTGLILQSEQLEADLKKLQAGLLLTQARIEYEIACIDLESATAADADNL